MELMGGRGEVSARCFLVWTVQAKCCVASVCAVVGAFEDVLVLEDACCPSCALLLARRLVHASLSCLIAAHGGVGTWQVRDTEVEEGGKVRCQVTWSKAHVGVVELVAAVGVQVCVCLA